MTMKAVHLLLFLCLVMISQYIHRTFAMEYSGPYDAMYNFGDSISDTGNNLLYGGSAYNNTGKRPYGMSFFRKPTGRYSNGRLIVDFFAEAFELAYLVPSLELMGLLSEKDHTRVNFSGASFAVGGATALDWTENSSAGTNASLSIQLSWFKQLKPYLCASEQDCRRFFKKSLFLVGEIGGNDYNDPFLEGKSMKEVKPLVQPVIEAISNAVITLIEEGATNLVVPGNFPFGCSSIYLTTFQSQNKTDYDLFGCLKAFNAFSKFHNSKLQSSLEKLRRKYPHAKIVYADYYGATMQYIKAPERYGWLAKTRFCRDTLLKACCGDGGKYNYNSSVHCGSEKISVCKDPSSYQNWDGNHFTEAAYRVISDGLLYRGFTTPPLIPINNGVFSA